MTAPAKLDRIDLKILAELQKNGRITNVDLADAVGLSPSPCLTRVKRLEQAGSITGYGTIFATDGFTNNGLLAQGAGPLTLQISGGQTNNANIDMAAGRQLDAWRRQRNDAVRRAGEIRRDDPHGEAAR